MNCFHAQTRHYLSNCLLLAWCHLCYVWASIYLMHVIVFNLQGITLNESRKLLSNYFFKQLLWNSNEILRHAIFPNIKPSCYLSIASVLFVNWHGRKMGLSPGTPGPPGPPTPLGLPGPSGPPVPQDPMDPRTLWDLRTSGPLINYLYRLKFRI